MNSRRGCAALTIVRSTAPTPKVVDEILLLIPSRLPQTQGVAGYPAQQLRPDGGAAASRQPRCIGWPK
jgi:hypothetical protein